MFKTLILAAIGILVGWFVVGLIDLIRRLLYKPDMSAIKYFRDSEGRIVIYHGVNVSNYSKHSPDLMPWQEHADYDRLKDWGFNLVRFVISWEGVEPQKDKYDFYYLERAKAHIDYLGTLGIDVIVDIHQDVYSKKYSGNGFPEWACVDGGKPFKRQDPWYKNYLQPATIAAFRYFWKSEELQNKYMAMLRVVAKHFILSQNVIGIDIINEPFPALPWIRRFERKWLTDFYRKAATSLSLEGFSKIMFFEPWMCTSSGVPTYLKFKPTSSKYCYMPHYYAPFCDIINKYRPIDKFLMKWGLRIKAKEAQIFGTPLLFGEFGISATCTEFLAYIKDFMALCEKYGASWTWWCYDKIQYSGHGLVDNDKNEMPFLKELCTIYAQRISGNNPRITRTPDSFTLEYDNVWMPSSTAVFVPGNMQHTVSTNMTYAKIGNVYLFYNTQDKISKITITVSK